MASFRCQRLLQLQLRSRQANRQASSSLPGHDSNPHKAWPVDISSTSGSGTGGHPPNFPNNGKKSVSIPAVAGGLAAAGLAYWAYTKWLSPHGHAGGEPRGRQWPQFDNQRDSDRTNRPLQQPYSTKYVDNEHDPAGPLKNPSSMPVIPNGLDNRYTVDGGKLHPTK